MTWSWPWSNSTHDGCHVTRPAGPLGLLLAASLAAACSSADVAAPGTDPATTAAATSTTASPEPPSAVPSTETIDDVDSGSTTAETTSDPDPVTETSPLVLVDAETCWGAPPLAPAGGDRVSFENVTTDVGLLEPLTGMHGHAAAAGDVNRDGRTDLFVGGFADRDASVYAVRGASGPTPDRLLLGGPDGFTIDPTFPDDLARTSGAVFADLDADGDDDLVVARNQRGRDGIGGRPSVVRENLGDGWVDRTVLAAGVGARSIAAVDLDRDGILDLVIVGDRWGDGPTEVHRGLGNFEFDDVTTEWGVPDDFRGLGAATVDLDGDGWVDVAMNGDPRVLLGGPNGFVAAVVPELAWETFGDEDDPAGIAVGDLDGDDRPDLVLGQHFNSTLDFGERVPVRILLNRSEPEAPAFDDVTDASGSPALWTKSPHVEIADVDNDGLSDVVTSATSASGSPVVLRQTGRVDGSPRFETVGDEGSGGYWVTGVTEDLDRDGRVDVFLVEWEPTLASVMAQNTSDSGSWLEIDTSTVPGAVGRAVSVEDSSSGDVLARAWSASTTGYAGGSSGIVHVGLGKAPDTVTVRIDTTDNEVRSIATVDTRTGVGGCLR